MRRGKLHQRLVPALLVKDMGRTLAFDRKLGSEPAACHPDAEHATWAEIARDGAVLQFHTEPPCGTTREPVCSGTFYLYPECVATLAEEWRGRVDFAWGPDVMEYGSREFGVRDPDGDHLAFTEPV